MTTMTVYTLADIAALCGLNRETVWRHVRRGNLAAHKHGNAWAVTDGAYHSWLAANPKLMKKKA